MHLTIDYLANRRDAIPLLAQWSFAEWRWLYDASGRTIDDATAAHEQRARVDALPIGIVAIVDDAVVGAGALKSDDLPLRPELTPWLASIFVAPEFRGRGVATAIVQRLGEEARRLQYRQLYLWTNSAAPLYAKLGWSELQSCDYCGERITIMVRQLTR
jgi:GNAT superfamily N-acetyltransferase